MAPPGAAPKRARRSRKRRRANSYEVSSDSDSDASSSAAVKPSKSKSAAEEKTQDKMEVDGEASSSDDSSASDSSDSSDSESDSGSSSDSSSSSSSSGASTKGKGKGKGKARAVPADNTVQDEVRVRKRIPGIRENSPTPPPVAIPGFLSAAGAAESAGQDRRSQFRKVYMEKLVEGFGSDLDKIRTSDPTMNPARLKRLIAGLQEAATLYENNTTAGGQGGQVDEMSVVLGQ